MFNAVVAVMAATGDTSAQHFGSEWLTDQSEPGFRYVWVTTSDSFAAPYKGGQPGYQAGPGNPRSLFTRKAGVEIHCWGVVLPPDDASSPDVYYDAGDVMATNMIAALHAVCGASLAVVGGGWVQPKSGTVDAYGRTYILGVTIDLPCPDTVYPLATITRMVLDTYGTDPSGNNEQLAQETVVT